MTVIDVRRDLDALTLTVEARFDAPVERVWQVWADPRKLERWWGPPGYPATFTAHDLAPGGETAYFMTSPEGDRHHGWWRVESVDPPRGLTFADGFSAVSITGNGEEALAQTIETIRSVRQGVKPPPYSARRRVMQSL